MAKRRSLEKIKKSEFVSISELVRLSGVRYSTIKFYTEEGLVPFEQEDTRLMRRYPRVKALERLKEIKRLKEEEGLTIKEIKEKLL
ncbi:MULTISPECIES: helix-turn-helix domain-containing protein [Aeribacillus]|jgi:DNA-binding transcriptional MerR regulator|uniref:MerR family transcriptional regulator n=2 Tax=Aeribacillus TaxID=1055323 RepID=A0A163XK09_9BACI|nr:MULTISPECIES: helix-turn-helix domain-containing protein [Aeribacillus]REJ27061.1 MAG: MerR family DNA-binding transcriptional regulator [Bacillaceae bacterium]KZM52519.1 MerR family transcriptional regulator [Aeribacillus pallidus]KZN97681.1 MerR family transcriptional regulator [Aeribacillus pallidus]MDR9794852.1 helix-turn-helix domain-containing protein [Aeribacillus pallidus]MDR9795295.1 helix-turn-helix domain-containing protein [Aeribacillus pallidus]